MATTDLRTSLTLLRFRVSVDLDQMDPALGAKLGPFHNMTSNQALVLAAAKSPSGQQVVKEAVARAKRERLAEEEGILVALDLVTVLLALPVLPHVESYLHFQVSPRHAYSAEDTVAHAARLVYLAESVGIPRSRVCIKIPATSAGMSAAYHLESPLFGDRDETVKKLAGGPIATLATAVFSVDQAWAAWQARCHFVAPYFNELGVHFEGGWKEYKDMGEHPMFSVVRNIVSMYNDRARYSAIRKTRVMPTSIVTAAEALALSTLGIDDLTLSGKVLEELADRPVTEADKTERPVPASWADPPPRQHPLGWGDFALLDGAIKDDPSVQARLHYALNKFTECEDQMIAIIRKAWSDEDAEGVEGSSTSG